MYTALVLWIVALVVIWKRRGGKSLAAAVPETAARAA
jgi:hypothetical protein